MEKFEKVKGLLRMKHEELFNLMPDGCTKGHSLGPQHKKTKLQLRARFFTSRVIPLSNRLPEHVVNSDKLDGFKNRRMFSGDGILRAGIISFGWKHKTHLLDLIMQLILCLSETK